MVMLPTTIALSALALATTTMGDAAVNDVIVAAEAQSSRDLAYQKICSYVPMSKVTDEAAIDLDLKHIMGELNAGVGSQYMSRARQVYEQGGYSMSIARIVLINPAGPQSFEAGSLVFGPRNLDGEQVSGQLVSPISWGDSGDNNRGRHNVTALVQYFVSDIQDSFSDCNVGGLFTFASAQLDGCFQNSGIVSIVSPGQSNTKAQNFAYAYNIRVDNMNGRTLQTFSKQAAANMKPCGDCKYYTEFQYFVDYYGREDYGDKWVMSAFYNQDGTHYNKDPNTGKFGRGNADFSLLKTQAGLAVAIQLGASYLNVFMGVIWKLEQALSICNQKDTNYTQVADAIHAVDQAVAFYAGSLEVDDCSGNGLLMAQLADSRAAQFKTKGKDSDSLEGLSYVTYEVMHHANMMQQELQTNQCQQATFHKNQIVYMMKVPLVQSVLRYAYIRANEDLGNETRVEQAEAAGATFAAAVLPFVHACNPDDAELIYQNMKIGSDPQQIDFGAIKKAFEHNYQCMGIQCVMVGGIWADTGYAHGASPCTFVWSNGHGKSKQQKAGISMGTLMGFAVCSVLVGYLFIRMRRARNSKEENVAFVRDGANIAAVSEIA